MPSPLQCIHVGLKAAGKLLVAGEQDNVVCCPESDLIGLRIPMLQETDTAAMLLAMLHSVAQDPLMSAMGAACIDRGLTHTGTEITTRQVPLSEIGMSLSHAGKRGAFPAKLLDFFKRQPTSRYLRFKVKSNDFITVKLLVGNIVSDHAAKLRQPSGASGSLPRLPSAQSTPSDRTLHSYVAPAAAAAVVTAAAPTVPRPPVPAPRATAAFPRLQQG